MNKRLKLKIVAAAAIALLAGTAFLTLTSTGRSAQFVVGGALINLGYRLQDRLHAYDFATREERELSPDEIWTEMLRQNRMSSGVRRTFPRTSHHPLVALVACMDARIDTNELTGDTRRYYYVIRTAGSVLEDKEAEMLELAVENGVKLIVLTTHSDCAAEGAAANPALRQRYPALTHAVDVRDQRINQLLARAPIAQRIAGGQLAVKLMNIDTMTEQLRPR